MICVLLTILLRHLPTFATAKVLQKNDIRKKMCVFYQNIAKIDTISVENMSIGICLSNFSVCVQTNHRCHAQTGRMHSVQ